MILCHGARRTLVRKRQTSDARHSLDNINIYIYMHRDTHEGDLSFLRAALRQPPAARSLRQEVSHRPLLLRLCVTLASAPLISRHYPIHPLHSAGAAQTFFSVHISLFFCPSFISLASALKPLWRVGLRGGGCQRSGCRFLTWMLLQQLLYGEEHKGELEKAERMCRAELNIEVE